ncbi:MAG: hypothetical protein KKC02_00190, partial [Gammaproteobacteria bacterium]|nr:hypothetical protein [Gammaproteobacteria bacterium]
PQTRQPLGDAVVDRSDEPCAALAAGAVPDPSLPHPVLEELARINPDDVTPRQALDLLYSLKTRI